ncbi:MAG TPA: cytochrome b/b6 domain-containing protein [Gammaproteobacteria bacterium]|nr:cytochrome b/b6 domain-containing protein [Gammaproteobacteria bacterium]
MQIKDAPAGYGWLSIGLHWANAVAVVMLWFIGNKMTGDAVTDTEAAELVRVHTSVAVTVYALVWTRIVWRFYSGHPKGLPDQGRIPFAVARTVHYTLLITLAAMLISGPLQVWLAGEAIGFYALGAIPSPFAPNAGLGEMCATAHRWAGNVLLVVALTHMAGAARQLVFAEGETARRMTAPTGR